MSIPLYLIALFFCRGKFYLRHSAVLKAVGCALHACGKMLPRLCYRPESGVHVITAVSPIFRGEFGFVNSKQLIVVVTKV